MGRLIAGRHRASAHIGCVCIFGLLLARCGRFGFETLPLVEDPSPPLQLDHSGPRETCWDSLQNQDETAADCGGVCGPCPVVPSGTCLDGVQNQDETAIDCGGVCAACPLAPSCSDGLQNQDETAIDCGGLRCPACIPTSCRQVVADSEANFSGTQGAGGWYYGYYAAPQLRSSNFRQFLLYEYAPTLSQYIWRYGDQAWTHVGARVQHPNGRFTTGGKLAIDHYAVRRWVSNTTETLFIQGTIQTTASSANGVVGRILVGDSQVWQQLVGPGPSSRIAFQTLASVRVGDAVNFVLEPYQSDDTRDATDFVVQLCR